MTVEDEATISSLVPLLVPVRTCNIRHVRVDRLKFRLPTLSGRRRFCLCDALDALDASVVGMQKILQFDGVAASSALPFTLPAFWPMKRYARRPRMICLSRRSCFGIREHPRSSSSHSVNSWSDSVFDRSACPGSI